MPQIPPFLRPIQSWLLARPSMSSARCGIITCWSLLALTTACSSVSAFLVLEDVDRHASLNRRNSNSISLLLSQLWSPQSNPRQTVLCQQASSSWASRTPDTNSTSTSLSQKEQSALKDLADNPKYIAMQVPDRGLESSHVIFGQLLKENLIESYTVYKLLSEVTSQTTSRGNGVVLVAAVKLGTDLDGHPNVVHGGILALLIDDILGFGYEALQVPHAVTANLNVNYRASVPGGAHILVTATLTERKERKLVWSVRVESLDKDVLYCEATSVYVIPKSASKSSSTSTEQVDEENQKAA
jgi:acyl-coenzyme A thioesterase PaaI-like protein